MGPQPRSAVLPRAPQTLLTRTKGKWRAAPLPAWTPGGARSGAMGGSSFVIPAKAKNPELAWRLYEFLTVSDEGIQAVYGPSDTYPGGLNTSVPAYLPALDPAKPLFQPVEALGGQDLWQADLVGGARDDFPVKLGPDFVVHKALATGSQPLRGLPNLNSEYGGGFTSVERGWHLRWQTQELRRHDRLSGYVYTELYDIEHESAGLLTFDREPKDLGGADPVAVNAVTTLVLDVGPVAPGRDILGTTATVGVHVSHHGAEAFTGRLTFAWGPVYSAGPVTEVVAGPAIEAKPYELGAAVTVTAELPDGWASGRLHLRAVTTDGRVAARACVDVDRNTAPHIGDDKLA